MAEPKKENLVPRMQYVVKVIYTSIAQLKLDKTEYEVSFAEGEHLAVEHDSVTAVFLVADSMEQIWLTITPGRSYKFRFVEGRWKAGNDFMYTVVQKELKNILKMDVKLLKGF